ncbi:ImmA/IrrE family metallo-endopeptidase [Mesorhizobium sp. M0833]|uniref:ImmA/IrrE family metallo-endopeptidase n=1 Tax=Mesorhizobium sp. M0833 TaxID=2957009 RepID=UPI00333BD99A
MEESTKRLVKGLKAAGLSDQAIDAAWPGWWSEDAEASESARAELRFVLARKLGLAPEPLLGERVEFVWKDDARFKNLSTEDAAEQAALASFGVAIGRILIRATDVGGKINGISALDLRAAILQNRPVVDLVSLIGFCWALGVPVIHLRVFPLAAKSMRAMVVEVSGRYAILLGRDASYPAPIAFTLAHEIGHAALGHIGGGKAIVDLGDADLVDEDPQEVEANEYALSVLTGTIRPEFAINTTNYSARSLAEAVIVAGRQHNIDAGTLALCVGHLHENWAVANAALRHIYPAKTEMWRGINQIAERQIKWAALNDETSDYLRVLMSGFDG